MRRSILLLCCWAAALAGCTKDGPDVQAEAEALVQQGKLEEAAARIDLICAFTPDGDPCRAEGPRAAELRIQARWQEVALGPPASPPPELTERELGPAAATTTPAAAVKTPGAIRAARACA